VKVSRAEASEKERLLEAQVQELMRRVEAARAGSPLRSKACLPVSLRRGGCFGEHVGKVIQFLVACCRFSRGSDDRPMEFALSSSTHATPDGRQLHHVSYPERGQNLLTKSP
jgi:hypothetical protein